MGKKWSNEWFNYLTINTVTSFDFEWISVYEQMSWINHSVIHLRMVTCFSPVWMVVLNELVEWMIQWLTQTHPICSFRIHWFTQIQLLDLILNESVLMNKRDEWIIRCQYFLTNLLNKCFKDSPIDCHLSLPPAHTYGNSMYHNNNRQCKFILL